MRVHVPLEVDEFTQRCVEFLHVLYSSRSSYQSMRASREYGREKTNGAVGLGVFLCGLELQRGVVVFDENVLERVGHDGPVEL